MCKVQRYDTGALSRKMNRDLQHLEGKASREEQNILHIGLCKELVVLVWKVKE